MGSLPSRLNRSASLRSIIKAFPNFPALIRFVRTNWRTRAGVTPSIRATCPVVSGSIPPSYRRRRLLGSKYSAPVHNIIPRRFHLTSKPASVIFSTTRSRCEGWIRIGSRIPRESISKCRRSHSTAFEFCGSNKKL